MIIKQPTANSIYRIHFLLKTAVGFLAKIALLWLSGTVSESGELFHCRTSYLMGKEGTWTLLYPGL